MRQFVWMLPAHLQRAWEEELRCQLLRAAAALLYRDSRQGWTRAWQWTWLQRSRLCFGSGTGADSAVLSGADPTTSIWAALEGEQHDRAQHISVSCQIPAAHEPGGCRLGQTWVPQTCPCAHSPRSLSLCPPRRLAHGSCSAGGDEYPGFRHQTSSVVPAAHGLCAVYTRKLYFRLSWVYVQLASPKLAITTLQPTPPSLFNMCSFKVFFF